MGWRTVERVLPCWPHAHFEVPRSWVRPWRSKGVSKYPGSCHGSRVASTREFLLLLPANCSSPPSPPPDTTATAVALSFPAANQPSWTRSSSPFSFRPRPLFRLALPQAPDNSTSGRSLHLRRTRHEAAASLVYSRVILFRPTRGPESFCRRYYVRSIGWLRYQTSMIFAAAQYTVRRPFSSRSPVETSLVLAPFYTWPSFPVFPLSCLWKFKIQ